MKTLIRLDLNVPIKNGNITDHSRITNYTSSMQELASKGNKICIITHLGRPKNHDPKLSTKNLIPDLEKAWKRNIIFVPIYDPVLINQQLENLKDNQILLLENTRYFEFEKNNDLKIAKKIASCFDRFIFDAFSTAHRKHMSTNAIAKYLPSSLGSTCKYEIKNLQETLNAEKPLIIMGGAKAQTKLTLIETFLKNCSNILVGGVLANTFLKAQGFNIQKSKYEPELIKFCKTLLQSPNSYKIILPFDFLSCKNLNDTNYRTTEILSQNEIIADIGPKSTQKFKEIIEKSNTVIFNGPLGYIENTNFSKNSIKILKEISKTEKSYLGGGDTLKLIKLAKLANKNFSFVSMAGGAMLEFLANNGDLEVINEITKK
jgi:phosphoglycerate kinase